MGRAILPGLMLVGCVGVGVVWAPDADAKDDPCEWSPVWSELHASFPKPPPGAKLTDAKKTKGTIARPAAIVRHYFQGPWVFEAVVDDKGDVRDLKAIAVPRIAPPWPEYEKALVGSIRKWKYKPLLVDGKPWPNCTTITINDQ